MKPQNFVYTGLNVTMAYEDLIYLPEQENNDSRAVSLDVTYTYGGETKTKTIEFRKDGVGDRFEVVRNHVYIFNIKGDRDSCWRRFEDGCGNLCGRLG